MTNIVYQLVEAYRGIDGELDLQSNLYDLKEKAVTEMNEKMELVRQTYEIAFVSIDKNVYGQLEDRLGNRYEFYLNKKEVM